MLFWALVACIIAACVISFLIGRLHPFESIRNEMMGFIVRRVMERLTRPYCTGDGWICMHEDGPRGVIAKLVRGDEMLILPDPDAIPEGAFVLFSPRLGAKEDRRMPHMCGLEDWMEMSFSRSLRPSEDAHEDES